MDTPKIWDYNLEQYIYQKLLLTWSNKYLKMTGSSGQICRNRVVGIKMSLETNVNTKLNKWTLTLSKHIL